MTPVHRTLLVLAFTLCVSWRTWAMDIFDLSLDEYVRSALEADRAWRSIRVLWETADDATKKTQTVLLKHYKDNSRQSIETAMFPIAAADNFIGDYESNRDTSAAVVAAFNEQLQDKIEHGTKYVTATREALEHYSRQIANVTRKVPAAPQQIADLEAQLRQVKEMIVNGQSYAEKLSKFRSESEKNRAKRAKAAKAADASKRAKIFAQEIDKSSREEFVAKSLSDTDKAYRAKFVERELATDGATRDRLTAELAALTAQSQAQIEKESFPSEEAFLSDFAGAFEDMLLSGRGERGYLPYLMVKAFDQQLGNKMDHANEAMVIRTITEDRMESVKTYLAELQAFYAKYHSMVVAEETRLWTEKMVADAERKASALQNELEALKAQASAARAEERNQLNAKIEKKEQEVAQNQKKILEVGQSLRKDPAPEKETGKGPSLGKEPKAKTSRTDAKTTPETKTTTEAKSEPQPTKKGFPTVLVVSLGAVLILLPALGGLLWWFAYAREASTSAAQGQPQEKQSEQP